MKNKPQYVHVATLCDGGSCGCCPEIYFDPEAPTDSCIVIVDDFDNEATFGIETVLITPLKPVDPDLQPEADGQHGIHGPFDEWIYMTPDQHHQLFSMELLERISQLADQCGIDLTPIADQLRELDPSLRFAFH